MTPVYAGAAAQSYQRKTPSMQKSEPRSVQGSSGEPCRQVKEAASLDVLVVALAFQAIRVSVAGGNGPAREGGGGRQGVISPIIGHPEGPDPSFHGGIFSMSTSKSVSLRPVESMG